MQFRRQLFSSSEWWRPEEKKSFIAEIPTATAAEARGLLSVCPLVFNCLCAALTPQSEGKVVKREVPQENPLIMANNNTFSKLLSLSSRAPRWFICCVFFFPFKYVKSTHDDEAPELRRLRSFTRFYAPFDLNKCTNANLCNYSE